jgi:hypothetical protein
MANDKEKKLDEYLREMMGTFTEEGIKKVSRLDLKNLGIKTPKEKPEILFVTYSQTSYQTKLKL